MHSCRFMNARRLRIRGAAGLVFFGWIWASPGWAVRPFVTDDARIIDVGQIETETWLEIVRGGGTSRPALQMLGGVTLNDWMEIIAGGGIGMDDIEGGRFSVANPVIQPKLLMWRADEDGFPGLAFAAGVTLPAGRGSLYEDATGFYLIAPMTSRLFDDRVQVHLNVGLTGAREDGKTELRPYWGVATEIEVRSGWPHLVTEAYAGDPLEALGPRWAVQYGFRWIASDHLNLDLTFGLQPDAAPGFGGLAHWGQIGVRLLFDAFTPGGKPGDFMGAPGAFSIRDR